MHQIVLSILKIKKTVLVGKVNSLNKENFKDIDYVFPGGKVNLAEGLEDAVKLEVLEESGVRLRNPQMIFHWIHLVTHVDIYYFIKVIDQALRDKVKVETDGDIEKFEWIPISKLFKFMPSIDKALVNSIRHFDDGK